MTTSNENITELYGHGPVMVLPDAPADWTHEVHGAGSQMLQLIHDHTDLADVVAALTALFFSRGDCVALLYHERTESTQELAPGTCYCGSLGGLSLSQDDVLAVGRLACAKLQLVSWFSNVEYALTSVPVCRPAAEPDAITVVSSHHTAREGEFQRSLELLAAHLGWWHVLRLASARDGEAEALAALHDLLGRAESCDGVVAAAQVIARQLKDHLGCDQVAIALSHRSSGKCRLRALSGAASFDRHGTLVSAMESALDEVILHNKWCFWPAESSADRAATLALQKLGDVARASCLAASPLRRADGEVVGAWLFLGKRKCLDCGGALGLLEAAEPRVASCLAMHNRRRHGAVRSRISRWFARHKHQKIALLLVTVAALCSLLAIPASYHIGCECQLEPVTRRYVAAPYDGVLREAYITAGASIAAGDRLASMEEREVSLQLLSAEAERDRAQTGRLRVCESQVRGGRNCPLGSGKTRHANRSARTKTEKSGDPEPHRWRCHGRRPRPGTRHACHARSDAVRGRAAGSHGC